MGLPSSAVVANPHNNPPRKLNAHDMQTTWKLVRLDASHPVTAFTCGAKPGAREIDEYLHTSALAEQAAGLSMVWVVEDTSADAPEARIVGFYTLSPVSVRLDKQLMAAVGITAPYMSIGGWLLGRMGIAAQHQGQQYGTLLVASAIATAKRLRDESAGPLLVVDPKHEKLMRWYQHLDFGFHRLMPTDDRNRRLVMKL
jgi:GNAT superfamily N-acetyltransferase